MKDYKWHLRAVVYTLLILIISAIACKKSATQASNVIRAMEIMSSSWGSVYTLEINGEPVSYLDGSETTVFVGYPIHGGTNQYSITVSFPSNFHARNNFPPRVGMLILTLECVGAIDNTLWEREDNVSESWTVDDDYSYESDFVMRDIGGNIEFETLGTNKQAYVAQCKLMSIKLANLIKRQDCSQLASVFGVRADNFATNYTPLIWSTNDYELECVGDALKLSAMTGDHLVLICSNPGLHLLSCTGKKAKENWRPNSTGELTHEGAYYYDSFVFGRLGGRWKIGVNGSGWRDLNVEKLIQ